MPGLRAWCHRAEDRAAVGSLIAPSPVSGDRWRGIPDHELVPRGRHRRSIVPTSISPPPTPPTLLATDPKRSPVALATDPKRSPVALATDPNRSPVALLY